MNFHVTAYCTASLLLNILVCCFWFYENTPSYIVRINPLKKLIRAVLSGYMLAIFYMAISWLAIRGYFFHFS